MKDFNLKELLQPVEEISRHAGAEIMRHYGGTNIYTKDDGSCVTDADHASENIILPALRRLTPHIPIVSEERVAAGEIPNVSDGTFWTVDPLDGTREFINKTDAFVVAISLVSAHKPILGVIYHPAMNLMYSGIGPGTASKVDSRGIRMPLAPDMTPPKTRRVLANETNAGITRIQEYLTARYSLPAQIDTKSGILRACQIADGLAEIAVVYTNRSEGRVAWWDVAPGHAIIESAGGRIRTLEDQELVYNADDLQLPPHIVISPGCALSEA